MIECRTSSCVSVRPSSDIPEKRGRVEGEVAAVCVGLAVEICRCGGEAAAAALNGAMDCDNRGRRDVRVVVRLATPSADRSVRCVVMMMAENTGRARAAICCC